MDSIQDHFYWRSFRLSWNVRSGNELNESNLPKLNRGWTAKEISVKLLKNWNLELLKNEPSLRSCLLKTYGKSFLLSFFLLFLSQCVLNMIATIIFGRLVDTMNAEVKTNISIPTVPKETESILSSPWAQAVAFALLQLSCHLIYVRAVYRLTYLSLKMRTGLTSLLYNVLLKSDKETQITFSRLNTIIANDLTKLDSGLRNLPYLLLCFFQFFIGIFVIAFYFKSSSLMGLLVLVIIVVIQAWLSQLVGKIRQKIAVKTDARVRFLREILASMNYIKMSVLESLVYKEYRNRRGNEMKLVRRRNVLLAIASAISEVGTKLIILATVAFLFFDSQDPASLSGKVFVLLTLYTTIYSNMGTNLPNGVSVFYEIQTTIKRVQDFLLGNGTGSLNPISFTQQKLGSSSYKAELNLENVSVNSVGFQNLNLTGKANDLIVITGGVGTGKTLLLRTILGEFPIDNGIMERQGTMSYCPQVPWVFNASIRDNITFGQEWNSDWYRIVLKACSLVQDLKSLPDGDQTLVSDGSGTGTLSGGQKTRINIARAVYADPDIILLDDPLSSLDVRVAQEIISKCILGILKNKLVILVTHSEECFQNATACYMVRDRELFALDKEKGKINNLESEFAGAISSFTFSEEQKSKEIIGTKAYGTFKTPKSKESLKQEIISWKIVWKYLKVGKSGVILFTTLCIIIQAQLLLNYSNLWLADWMDSGGDPTGYYLKIFTIIVFISTLFTFARAYAIYDNLYLSSFKTHDSMISSVLKAPFEFFYSNTGGRILNRFTTDTTYMDELIPQSIYSLTTCGLEAFGGAIVSILAAGSIFVLIGFIIISGIVAWMREIYGRGVSIIKRIEGGSRSPILSHLNATYSGLTLLKTLGQENYFLEMFYAFQDAYSRAVLAYTGSLAWFCLSVLFLVDVFIFVVLFISLLNSEGGTEVGLALASSLNVVTQTSSAVLQSARITNLFVSVERGMEYMEIPPEEDSEFNCQRVANWPSNGIMDFDQVSLIYANKTVGLRDVSFGVKDCERVGIVGRTGSGKSTLLMALFRLVPPKAGSIHIAYMDTQVLRLKDLRRALSILPQNPVLLSGSVRTNLDPFNEHSDPDLWSALNKTGLSEKFRSLDEEISDDVGQLSEGEKQLLLFGRIILQKSKVVVLDEPTSHIDQETEERIQKLLRESLSNSTILMIAHKLDSIMDFDRILVLDGGEVSEFDTPYNLLQNPNSKLSLLIQSAGKHGWREELLKKLIESKL